MTLWPLVRHALAYGVILAATLFPLTLAVLWFNPEIMFKSYPPDIRAKHGPMSERSRRQRLPAAILFLALIIAIVAASFSRVRAMAGGDISFLTAFGHVFIMFTVFNLLDWLVLDWPLVFLQPRFVVLPGTEGLAGYGDYWLPFRGFLIGVAITTVASILTAAIVGFYW